MAVENVSAGSHAKAVFPKDNFPFIWEAKQRKEPDFRCEFGKNISIRNHVLIGPNLGIYAVNHGFDPEERIAGACMGKPVHIEDKAWISGDVKILAGVTIGEGSIIGAGSIVTKNIPAKVIAAGNPCRVIRPITGEDRLGFLEPNI